MNWVGDFIQENIEETDTVLDLGCGIMQATLDIVASYPKTRLKCKRLFGVDIHQPYLDFLNTLGIETLRWDLRDIPLPFDSKSFDVVLLTDILEHLSNMNDVNKLIEESIRIARKQVIALTPKEFTNNIDAIHNPYPYDQFDEVNEFQQHHLLIKRKHLEKHGFKVKIKSIHFIAIRKLVNKIIHVWNVAGVSSIMCKYQNKLGYNSKLYASKVLDTYGYSKVYSENVIDHYQPKTFMTNNKYLKPIRNKKIYLIIKKVINQLNFILKLNKIVKDFKPDIIHFHELFYIPIIFKLMNYRLLIEFHGTGIRYKYVDGSINLNRKIPKWIFRLYWLFRIPIFVSTPDLLIDVPDYNKPRNMSKLISNPVDKDIFNISKHRPISGVGLFSLNNYDINNLEIAIIRAKKRNYRLVIHDRAKGIFLNHLEFAKYLSSFECYIDRINIGSLSKTALESLAMGLKVVDWKDKTVEGLPNEHDPYNVAKLTVYIYDKILVGKI